MTSLTSLGPFFLFLFSSLSPLPNVPLWSWLSPYHCCPPLVVIIVMPSSSLLFLVLLLLSSHHLHCSPHPSLSPSSSPHCHCLGGGHVILIQLKKPVINKKEKLAEMKIKKSYLGPNDACASFGPVTCIQNGSFSAMFQPGACTVDLIW